MSRFHSYINSALEILGKYDGSKPFPFFIKHYFSLNKKYGSRDRKTISEICYQWFRSARLFKNELNVENLQKAIFLNSPQSSPLLANVSSTLNEKADESPMQKLAWLGKSAHDLFPFFDKLGESIDAPALALSYLQQPDLFIRSRPGKNKLVADRLNSNGILFDQKREDCFALPNGTKLEDILAINKEAVIQDKNSQSVFDHLPAAACPGSLKVWDCCAASGGKSILLNDRLERSVQLTVSDIRKTILHNCLERLKEASVPVHQHFLADLSKPRKLPIAADFDLIVCDAPCTGSGTWSRTPEQLAYFSEASITEFSALQQEIASHVISYLKPGGIFAYITCSVFKKENEQVIAELMEKENVTFASSEYFYGYTEKADSMFVSFLKKNATV